MVGMVFPEATRCRCSSRPVIPGICTSAIRHEVPGTWREVKNSSADAKAWAVYPNDFMSPLTASRIDSSSSTTEIRGLVFGTLPPSSRFPGRGRAAVRGHWAGDIRQRFKEGKTKLSGARLYFRLNRIAAGANVDRRLRVVDKVKKSFLQRVHDFRMFRLRDCRRPESCGAAI